MNNLTYGSGVCAIDTSVIVAISIKYSGNIFLSDKTPEAYSILEKNNSIIIFPISKFIVLSNLFAYSGELKIKSAKGSDINGKLINITIKENLSLAEALDTNAEDLTIDSEKLNAGRIVGKKIRNTKLNLQTINNLSLDNFFYLKDGSPYNGEYHIHKNNLRAMTGAKHTKESEDLYFYNRNAKLVLTGEK